jgi:hypothetical protein
MSPGNRNGFKHGLYSAEAITRRCKVGALLRAARKLIRTAALMMVLRSQAASEARDSGAFPPKHR